MQTITEHRRFLTSLNCESLTVRQVTHTFNKKFNSNYSEDAIRRKLVRLKKNFKKAAANHLSFFNEIDCNSLTTNEITVLFNERFKTTHTVKTIAEKMRRLGIKYRHKRKSKGSGRKPYLFSKKQVSFIKTNCSDNTLDELTEKLNIQFKTTFKKRQIFNKLNAAGLSAKKKERAKPQPKRTSVKKVTVAVSTKSPKPKAKKVIFIEKKRTSKLLLEDLEAVSIPVKERVMPKAKATTDFVQRILKGEQF